MQAMVLTVNGSPLEWIERPDPVPGPGELRVRVAACGVCRTDLHVTDGELPNPRLPIIPGHEIVGYVDALGEGVSGFHIGERVGIPWLGHTCGACPYCRSGHENLCDAPEFTGYTRDGGYATMVTAEAQFTFPLGGPGNDVDLAPLLCAGLIGWRSLVMAGDGKRLGLYGFGAAAHIIAQIARWQGRDIYAFTRPGNLASQRFALDLGAHWAGGSDETPPEFLDAAILFAPVGALVPQALRAVRKGGQVVCAGIHMSDIPSFPYSLLWEERKVVSVANLTRKDALEFLSLALQIGVKTQITTYPLRDANRALSDLRAGCFDGAAVLVPQAGTGKQLDLSCANGCRLHLKQGY
ncbi:Alcohol dehydrogenase [Granulibacter bethesdensis]|uniref:alcohol dehydrogenase n=1 Tax=Granulibacter bethesdensis TaxID=364410 RepID=A0AAC9KDM1_9PROT|nr:zinc-dependent alcohol dehydrogenase family protein [Granulibacter bethesdensis]APH54218.1 Alcohol dehydrogenase [Granulibacter bethesdensis]APH61801.1 Alcohol dehydrogenase [Granulibacter bethesdensis]